MTINYSLNEKGSQICKRISVNRAVQIMKSMRTLAPESTKKKKGSTEPSKVIVNQNSLKDRQSKQNSHCCYV